MFIKRHSHFFMNRKKKQFKFYIHNFRSSNGCSNESLESLNLSTEDPESDREMDIEEENEECQELLEEEKLNYSEKNGIFPKKSEEEEVEVDDCIGVEVEP